MPDFHQIRHVFFDLDRTLWDFDVNARAAIADIYSHHCLHECGMPETNTFYETYSAYNDQCWDDYRNNRMSKNYLRHHRFYLTLRHFGTEDRDLAKTLSEKYVQISPYKNVLIEGAREVLEYLHTKYKLHIITNGFDEVQQIKLREAGIEKYFTHVITSERVGRRKPDPMIFEFALRKSGATPKDSVMVGDDYEIDVKGAEQLGIPAILFSPGKEKPCECEIHIEHLNRLFDLL